MAGHSHRAWFAIRGFCILLSFSVCANCNGRLQSKNMSKTKSLVIVGGTIGLLGLVGVGWLLWPGRNNRTQTHNPTGVKGAYAEQRLMPFDGPNGISLTSPRPQSGANGGLMVDSGSAANNLGQLIPDSNGSNNSTNSKKSTPSPFDPATFSQYDKYKEDNAALFGEVQVGNGDELTMGKKAAVYYKGWLTDGRLFDMSRPGEDGKLQHFVFEMGARQVIPGWEQGLIGMKVGGTRLVIVPPAVGYGPAGQNPIPGNAVLVFQVQLVAVE